MIFPNKNLPPSSCLVLFRKWEIVIIIIGFWIIPKLPLLVGEIILLESGLPIGHFRFSLVQRAGSFRTKEFHKSHLCACVMCQSVCSTSREPCDWVTLTLPFLISPAQFLLLHVHGFFYGVDPPHIWSFSFPDAFNFSREPYLSCDQSRTPSVLSFLPLVMFQV